MFYLCFNTFATRTNDRLNGDSFFKKSFVMMPTLRRNRSVLFVYYRRPPFAGRDKKKEKKEILYIIL